MRVVSGQAGSRKLRGPSGSNTRPMADRVKEALFSILENAMAHHRPAGLETASLGDPDLWGGLFAVDMFAGTGSLGIEILSRGAEHVDFVDFDENACRVIHDNLTSTGLTASARVYRRSADQFLAVLAQRTTTYHLVVLDPPYAVADRVGHWLDKLGHSSGIAANGLVAIGHSSRITFADQYGKLEVISRKTYGGPALAIFRYVIAGPDHAS